MPDNALKGVFALKIKRSGVREAPTLCEDLDGGFSFKGAFVLADAAAIAQPFNNIGPFQGDGFAAVVLLFNHLEAYGLFRDRAMFLANDAVDLSGIGEAMVFIKVRNTYDALLLFFKV